MEQSYRLAHPSVNLSVSLSLCPGCIVEKRLSASGCHLGWWVGRSRDWCIRWGGDRPMEGTVLWLIFWASHCNHTGLCDVVISAMRGGDTALPELLWDFLLVITLPQPWERMQHIVTSESVCPCVCPLTYFENQVAELYHIFYTCCQCRGSIVLRWWCNKLCTGRCMDDITFYIMGWVSCIFLSYKSRNNRINSDQILLHKEDQQVHIVGCILRPKSAI